MIAIDGPAGAGKTTVAKLVAEGAIHINSTDMTVDEIVTTILEYMKK